MYIKAFNTTFMWLLVDFLLVKNIFNIIFTSTWESRLIGAIGPDCLTVNLCTAEYLRFKLADK